MVKSLLYEFLNEHDKNLCCLYVQRKERGYDDEAVFY